MHENKRSSVNNGMTQHKDHEEEATVRLNQSTEWEMKRTLTLFEVSESRRCRTLNARQHYAERILLKPYPLSPILLILSHWEIEWRPSAKRCPNVWRNGRMGFMCTWHNTKTQAGMCTQSKRLQPSSPHMCTHSIQKCRWKSDGTVPTQS